MLPELPGMRTAQKGLPKSATLFNLYQQVAAARRAKRPPNRPQRPTTQRVSLQGPGTFTAQQGTTLPTPPPMPQPVAPPQLATALQNYLTTIRQRLGLPQT